MNNTNSVLIKSMLCAIAYSSSKTPNTFNSVTLELTENIFREIRYSDDIKLTQKIKLLEDLKEEMNTYQSYRNDGKGFEKAIKFLEDSLSIINYGA